MSNYYKEARDDAKEMADYFIDEIVEQIINTGEASKDLYNDYPDGDAYHHEGHVDKWYNLHEAADILSQLSEYVEDDSGLWEGLEPERAIGAMAAYTYGNAVMETWQKIIEDINSEIIEVKFDYMDVENEAKVKKVVEKTIKDF